MGILTIGGTYGEVRNPQPNSRSQKAAKSNKSSFDKAPYTPIIVFLIILILMYFAHDTTITSSQPLPCPQTCDRRVDILLTQNPIVVNRGGVSLRGVVKNTFDLLPRESEVVFSTREISAFSLKKDDLAHFNCTFDNNGRRIYECDLIDTTIIH